MRLAASCAVEVQNLSFDKPYTYLLPVSGSYQVGSRVRVPFGVKDRLREGVILGFLEVDDAECKKLKTIVSKQGEQGAFDEDMLRLAMWLRRRCYCTLFEILRTMIPSAITAVESKREMIKAAFPEDKLAEVLEINKRLGDNSKMVLRLLSKEDMALGDLLQKLDIQRSLIKSLEKRGLISLYFVYGDRTMPVIRPEREIVSKIDLAHTQMMVYNGLRSLAFSMKYTCALLHGITGSGKTHIYMKLISDVLANGKSALLLVPEIALTPQMITRFTAVFGNRIACMHSGLGNKERRTQYLQIKSGEADVVIGTRSAVFAPIPQERLGIIILDEEHEESYKSESSPRYHARDVAKYRAAKSKILLLLGSATPSIETEYAAEKGEIFSYELTERFNKATLAQVEIVSRANDIKNGNDNAIGSILQNYIENTIKRGEQTILFLNRRGRNRRIICTDCGEAIQCPHCTNALSFHGSVHKLVCHICGYATDVPQVCPFCGSQHLLPNRAGTQLIEEEIQRLFPTASYLRMDADTASVKGGHETIITKFDKEKIDILIGTQMVTKGLDFANVTLVGVLDADMSLYANDFRAGERTFSLLTQVVGRSGRGMRQGHAIIQSYSPQNPVLRAAAEQDYHAFYRQEIEWRRQLDMPPFSQVLSFAFSGEQEQQVEKLAKAFSSDLSDLIDQRKNVILGPAKPNIYKANNRYRWTIQIKSVDLTPLRKVAEGLMSHYMKKKEYKGIVLSADENPYDLM